MVSLSRVNHDVKLLGENRNKIEEMRQSIFCFDVSTRAQQCAIHLELILLSVFLRAVGAGEPGFLVRLTVPLQVVGRAILLPTRLAGEIFPVCIQKQSSFWRRFTLPDSCEVVDVTLLQHRFDQLGNN